MFAKRVFFRVSKYHLPQRNSYFIIIKSNYFTNTSEIELK